MTKFNYISILFVFIFSCMLSGIILRNFVVKNNELIINMDPRPSPVVEIIDYYEWENMFDFLHMNSHSLCEDIFSRQDEGSNYTDKLMPFYELVKDHDKMMNNIILSNKYKKNLCREGYSANYHEETYVMWHLARLPFVKTICETGFNAGHSALMWLTANPKAQVYMFDLGNMKCARPMAKYLMSKYADRLNITWGDSKKTLPQFIEQNPHIKCDLMLIDGGHIFDVASSDMKHFKLMASDSKNIVFLDNYPDRRFKNELSRVWETEKRKGVLMEIFRCHYKSYKAGFTFGRFIAN